TSALRIHDTHRQVHRIAIGVGQTDDHHDNDDNNNDDNNNNDGSADHGCTNDHRRPDHDLRSCCHHDPCGHNDCTCRVGRRSGAQCLDACCLRPHGINGCPDYDSARIRHHGAAGHHGIAGGRQHDIHHVDDNHNHDHIAARAVG
ncbi:MAG: hypothetical protein ACKODP_08825, partial [Actinomycetota bacterium]